MSRLTPLSDEEERLLEKTALEFDLDPDFISHILDLTRSTGGGPKRNIAVSLKN